ncbi:biotin--[acetyl-CoA-carboxylase] ligase [Francisella frigiditurris]|uniref:Bifunctional ligase/repressor BirA n=1 Tax=Francisella frigiditurris TaxID=1542390 RepID=A0A1J0KRD8_9GAMM|nr:biotin--[acetyl-CoA-carboxylase] ligase [Francisella frigiditurris]APC96214.1 biotin--[acetyl-CoA-carboxylase] ligase [Francisella frigiditurris]
MNKTQQLIFNFLDDQKYISGTDIGNKLGISRAAVSKNIKKLKDTYKINILSNPRVGYLLEEKLDIIDKDKLNKKFKNIEYFYTIDSTSNYAIRKQNNFLENTVFISEHQTQGFGRFNREWVSPFGKNIYCTLLEFVDLDISKLPGLSLVISISISRTLEKIGLNPKLKWPNDIFINNKKIAGVIINVSAEVNDKAKLFIGFGLNVNMQKDNKIKTEWTSLKLELQTHIDRTKLLSEIIKNIQNDIKIFTNEGFSYFKEEYEKINYLKDKLFTLKLGNKEFNDCKYIGLSDIGEIIISSEEKTYSFSSGEISILDNSIKSK